MNYDLERDEIEISVTELCDMALISGDIDCRHSGFDLKKRGAEGRKIHRRLQSEFGVGYHSEVELKNTSKLEEVYFHVRGCADGIQCIGGEYTVDEIKTVSGRSFSSGTVDSHHVARLYCYAYFLCRTKELAGVNTRIIYYNTDDGDIEYKEKYVSLEDLRDLYLTLLSKVLWRARLLRDRANKRMPAAADARFPYSSLRDSQEEMIKECYRDIKHGNKLFCQAPTGIGKTVSTLYPAIKCMGEGIADKIFYLTSKASIRREAYSAAGKMNDAGVGVRSCVLSAREQMCICQSAKVSGGRLSSNCNPQLCPFAKGYYDRAEGALRELIASSDRYDSAHIRSMAQKHMICPYELSLDLSELCDIIICDYNYVFSPTVYLKRYFDDREGRKEKYIFLVDEAHNLPDRARDMFSSRLSNEQFETIVALVGENSRLTDACDSVIRIFNRLGGLCKDNTTYDASGACAGYYVSRELPENLLKELASFSERCDAWMRCNRDHSAYFAVEDLSFKIFEFRKICECFDRHYLTFINVKENKVSILLYCLDPSNQLSVALERARASVLFSATLTPTDYFADILGGGKGAVSVSFRSPFPHENLCVAAVDTVSTRYEDRERSYKKIAACIAATVSAKAGNYMVFFPSYGYMEQVHKVFSAKYPKVKTLLQKRNMSLAQKDEFLGSFKDDKGILRIGFCVLGGSFSEGVDLPGRRLIGVVVVGVGLPGISDENNIIRDYFEEKSGAGYDYAYTYPGMNSVLQAVGRVIRTEEDNGIAVLIDDRYADPKYRALFPTEWKGIKYAGNPRSLAEIARRFWEKSK